MMKNKNKGGCEGSRKKRKGEGENPGDELAKKPKVEPEADSEKASVGHGVNVNERHLKQLESLLALMSVKRQPLKITDNKADVLEIPSCLNGVYLQWDRNDDCYFLWASTASKKFQIKFQFHGGFEASASHLEIKNPLLVFSELFDLNDGWREVEQLLRELFGRQDGEGTTGEHDCLLAFTRTGVMFHFRIFKILSALSSDMKNMKLQEASPAFMLKPLEIHEDLPDTKGGSTNYRKMLFFNEERLMFESNNGLNLVSSAVFYDNSCTTMVPHVMSDLHTVMLPLPEKKSEWFEFSTSCEEFFERYYVSRKTHVPGTGVDPNPPTMSVAKEKKKKKKKSANPTTPLAATVNPTQVAAPYNPTPLADTAVNYKQITVSMRVFCRLLIKHVADLFKAGACLADFTEKNIFLRGGKLAILGVMLLPYSEPQAKRNCTAIYTIINERVKKLSPDVKAVLRRLNGADPIGNLDIILNNVAWMVSLERNHMVCDLYEDYIEHLGADMQVTVARNLKGMVSKDGKQTWEEKFKKNWLIYACHAYSLPEHATASSAGMLSYMKRKASELQAQPDDPNLDVLTSKDAQRELDLYMGRRYFANIRHLYTHLSDTARKVKKMKALTEEEKDLIVSSEFAATLSSMQVHVPAAFQGIDPKRASYTRFKNYFKVDEFDSSDEK